MHPDTFGVLHTWLADGAPVRKKLVCTPTRSREGERLALDVGAKVAQLVNSYSFETRRVNGTRHDVMSASRTSDLNSPKPFSFSRTGTHKFQRVNHLRRRARARATWAT